MALLDQSLRPRFSTQVSKLHFQISEHGLSWEHCWINSYARRENREIHSKFRNLTWKWQRFRRLRKDSLKKRSFRNFSKYTKFDPIIDLAPTGQEKISPDIELFAGSAYNIITREFAHWALTSEISRKFISWSNDTYSPDETIWASLVRVPEGSQSWNLIILWYYYYDTIFLIVSIY